MMTAERIQEAAFVRFAAQGYDATSLAEIATDVGIKKPSIYAHFAGKKALFLGLLDQSIEEELAFARRNLQCGTPVFNALYGYLQATVDRFVCSASFRFWLRAVYAPPSEMLAEITGSDRRYAASLKLIISEALRHPASGFKNPPLPDAVLTMAYIGILRSIHAELLYGANSSQELLSAMWQVFQRGATCEEKTGKAV